MPLILDGLNGESFPTWTTATRPSSPIAGQLGYNSTLNVLECYNGSSWATGGLISPGTSGNILTSNGTEWVSSPQAGLGYSQTWSLPTRVAGTTYTNSTSRPIFVMININQTLAGNGNITILVGAVTIFSSGYGSNATGSNQPNSAMFIVPIGATYLITVSGGTSVSSWAELS
jgi:hypothetical protein